MSKKDYELIAHVVGTIMDPETRWAVADAFAKALFKDNEARNWREGNKPTFNINTFMAACRAPARADNTVAAGDGTLRSPIK